MALDGIDLLLVRPEDLVVALVRLDGFDLDGETLTAGAGGGHLVLTLPPQATAETTYDVATAASRGRVSGPSRLTLLVPAGSSAPFTASGVLGLACVSPGTGRTAASGVSRTPAPAGPCPACYRRRVMQATRAPHERTDSGSRP